eukprot:9423338-Alexandrium_andersonii.AAC.1
MGVGVWCPDEGHEGPIARLEGPILDFVFDRSMRTGHAYWTKASGVRPSTTRTETFALLVALHTGQPACIGIDNESARRKLHLLTRG